MAKWRGNTLALRKKILNLSALACGPRRAYESGRRTVMTAVIVFQ
jgi:hypothetical protein